MRVCGSRKDEVVVEVVEELELELELELVVESWLCWELELVVGVVVVSELVDV